MGGGSGETGRSGRVVVVGSLNLDHTVMVERLPGRGETVSGSAYSTAAGGKGLNQAVAAARQGASVAMVGAVGDDPAGSLLAGVLADEAVDVRPLRRVAGPSGTAMVTVDRQGDNTIVVAAGANAALRVADLVPEVFAGAAVVVCQLEVPTDVVGAALEAARRVGALGILNPAPASSPLPVELLSLADLVVPNEGEAAALAPGSTGTGPLDRAGAAGRRLLEGGAGAVIVTLGSRGALIIGGDRVTPVAPFRVGALDPTAAGDAFVGTLAAALAAGEPMLAAARRAAAAGALATTRVGAVPSLPDRTAVDRLVADERAGAGPAERPTDGVEGPGAAGGRSRPAPAAAPSSGPRRRPPYSGPGSGRGRHGRPAGPRG